MSFAISTAIDRAKRRLGIPGITKYDTAFLEWVNDFSTVLRAELGILNRGWDETEQYTDLVANQYAYTIPGNIILISSVRYLYDGVYYEIDECPALKHSDYNPTSPQSNTITGYFFSGSKIHLRGAPAQNTTNGLMFVGYADTTDAAASSETLSYHNHVRLLYTLYLCKSFRDMLADKEMNKEEVEFERQMQLFRNYMFLRNQGPHSVGYEEAGYPT